MKEQLLKKLHDEISQLDRELKLELPLEIKRARELGDLRENAEYHAAKEKQSHIEGRILDLNDWIARAEVIDTSKIKGETVVFGATVVLRDSETEKLVTYRIVGEDEADPSAGTLSYVSPVAQALMGKQVGDVVEAGAGEAEIVEIS